MFQVLSSEEREAERKRQLEAEEAMIAASHERRQMLEASAAACADLDAVDSDKEQDERENRHHIVERAAALREEAMPEVKQLNQWIVEAKCAAIRDMQMAEKERRL